MTRPLALFALLSLGACAAAPPPAAPAEPPSPTSFTLGSPHEQTPADGEMVAIGRAEAEIDRLFPEVTSEVTVRGGAPRKNGAPAQHAPPQADADGKADKLAEKKEEEKPASSGPAITGDRCAIACKALASMSASADHLCQLTGEGDGRCDDARARVRGASARVRSACPACGASTPPPPG
jgi:hypothetical protein